MNSVSKTLFGRLYYLNNMSHFQLKKDSFYCESFCLFDRYYGIFGYNKINLDNSNFELYSELIIGSKNNGLKWQEKYRYINNREHIYSDIPDYIIEIMHMKNNCHIINCSCCHRY